MISTRSVKVIHSGSPGPRLQNGFTVVETMVSIALSLVVTTSMVVLMANSLGTASRMVQMSQMTNEMRNAMSMMTRDVRRANYSPDAIKCFSNSDCGIDGTASQLAGDVTVVGGSCFTFNLNRFEDVGGVPTQVDGTGGFRRASAGDGSPGWIEMWIGGEEDPAPECPPTPSSLPDNPELWVAVTDPDFVNITDFVVDDSLSFTGTVEDAGGTLTQKSRKIQIQIEGSLLLDPGITRRIEDIIQVRNDIFL